MKEIQLDELIRNYKEIKDLVDKNIKILIVKDKEPLFNLSPYKPNEEIVDYSEEEVFDLVNDIIE